MENPSEHQKPPKTLTLADLHRLSRPLTGASSLNLSPPILKPLSQNTPKIPLFLPPQTPIKTLNSLNHPAVISGTLSLSSPATSPSLSSFSFTDGSLTLPCDILGFTPDAVSSRIHVTAWNFIPSEKDGFLEIINWEFDGSRDFRMDSFSIGNLGCGGGIDVKARYCIRGGLVSVSPVSIVPCSTGSDSKSTNVSGFLVNLSVCGCKLCNSKDSGVGLGKDHSFVNPAIVYFCGCDASLWRPVMIKLLGRVVSLEFLKKKLVFIGEEESQLMYVTTEKSLLRVFSDEKWVTGNKVVVKGKGECGSYTGTVTGIYMKGMVVELDQNVFLVVTDQLIVLPLSVRVGAIVSVRNAHFVNPNFSWTKILILGACYRTSVCLESFSPLETGCYIYSKSQSQLGNFIDSLVYSARLWVLLLVSSFRKKFRGFLSEHEILGSKLLMWTVARCYQRKGLVQSFATSHLPSSVFRSRHGLFREYCKHESCSCDKDPFNVQLKLVAPIFNVVAHCNAARMKSILEQDADSELTYDCGQSNSFSCEGVHYSQRFRSILQSYEMGVALLGFLKVSPTSGRLQLSDSTGSIDVFFPDISSTLGVNNKYVVNDFRLVTEGRTPEHKNHLEILSDVSFSCKSIFTGLRCKREVEVEMYVFCHLRDAKLLGHPLSPVVENSESILELQSGLFHMLLVTHKYPFKQKIQGEHAITNGSSVFAEVLLLPWDLNIVKKDRHCSPTYLSAESQKESVDEYSNGMYQNFVPSKRLKKEQGSSEFSYGLHGCTGLSSSLEISCFVTYRGFNNQWLSSSATLSGSKSSINISSGKKPQAQKLLLEFKSESICNYQVLKVGSYYIIKHHKEDMFCSLNPISHPYSSKVIVSSTTHLWSSSFSSDQDVNFANYGPRNELLFPRSNYEFPQMQPDITIHLSNHELDFVKDNLKRLDENIMKPLGSLKEVAKFSGIIGLVPSLGKLAYSCQLPEGDLISLHGEVLLFHNRGCNAKSRGQIFNATKGICIHILVDHCPARIVGSSSSYAYPVGFGPGCSADFHRILVMSGRNELIMTPSSYIEIRSVMLSAEEQCDKGNKKLVPSNLCPTVSIDNIPSILISDVMQHVGCKAVQFRCRIVAICVLLMEKNRIAVYPQTSSHPSSDVLHVPLAGFVMDDGSSSSCFWAKDELAVTLLRLNEKVSHEMVVKPRGSKQNFSTTCNYLGRIVKKHGVVTVRNYGSVYDSTSQDLTVSVNPNAVINSTDEKFIKCVILNACFGTCWIVVGNLMGSHAVRKLEKRLAEMDMTMHHMENIWVQEVHHVDPLVEARRVMQELIMSY